MDLSDAYQYSMATATADSAAGTAEISALVSFVTTVVNAAKAQADAMADAAEARVVTEVGHALTATADEAAAATTAAKAVASAQAAAATATVAAGQVLAIAAIGAGKVFADANIDASLTASNGAVDAVHTSVVASIGVNLVASTAAIGLALLRENGAISALTDAQKTVINAAHASTLANLAADLSRRNANEALDDPIAIAAAQKAAADGVKAAWQNVSNLQARAASAFAGTGPNGGGFAMTFAGLFTIDSWSSFVISWDYVLGDFQSGWFAQVSNFSAGWGDTLSFGLTSGVRYLLGYKTAVDFSSNAYFGGQIVGTLHGLAMMGANAATNIARQGSVVRYFWDPRTWKSVVRTWSGRPPILRANGLSLHHVLIPQRWTWVPAGFRNAGMNYMVMSAWRNSVTLNRLAPLRPVEWAYRFGYLTQFNPLVNPLVGQ
jgi:hypothetical protein